MTSTGQRWEDIPHDPADLALPAVPHLAVGDRQWLHLPERLGYPAYDGAGYFAACGAGAFGIPWGVTQDVAAVRCPDCFGKRP